MATRGERRAFNAPSRAGTWGNYGSSDIAKPPAPAPPAGQYPGALPVYGPPRDYGTPPSYGTPPKYEFAPNPQLSQQSAQMAYLAYQRQKQEEQARAAELFQIQSQWQAPRQSRITLLGGY